MTKAHPDFWQIALEPAALEQPREVPVVEEKTGRFSVSSGRFHGEFSRKERRGRLRVRNTAAVTTFLRAFLSHVLTKERGFLLHGAGVRVNDGACLLAGVSGSGKSTLSRMAAPGDVLSDELVLAHRGDARWQAYGTPFYGDVRRNQPAGYPLRAVFLLEKAGEWSAERLSQSDAARGLLKCVLNFSAGREGYSSLLDNTADLTAAVPCLRLRFAKKRPHGKSLTATLDGLLRSEGLS
ncbi:MAG TPA: hypothetical protein P5079_10415 [Elusimicrobiota bacterium]|nr:hypothetical protein [Elusimicrobiota bacterium]